MNRPGAAIASPPAAMYSNSTLEGIRFARADTRVESASITWFSDSTYSRGALSTRLYRTAAANCPAID